jgi:hypothetical protein
MREASTGILEQIYSHVFTCLEGLIEQVFSSGYPTAQFQVAREVLEALPLTTAEFATARNRLENARSYLECGERGAARYELRLLRRSLKQ